MGEGDWNYLLGNVALLLQSRSFLCTRIVKPVLHLSAAQSTQSPEYMLCNVLFFFQTKDVLKLYISLCCSCMSFSWFYGLVRFRYKRWWVGLSNLVKSNQWLHAYILYVDTASQTVVSGLEMSTKRLFSCRKCGWKCQKYPVLSSVNTAGNVITSR